MAAAPACVDYVGLKLRLQRTWSAGDYDTFSRYMVPGAVEFFRGLDLTPEARMLDVGCGSGQLALIAARAGMQVTGCDIADNWLEKARERAREEGLSIEFELGDAETLPYEDGAFDVVASLVGAMFAPRPQIVASELTRVCRAGGKVIMANWTPDGFIGTMFRTIARHIAPPGMPSPVLWGDEGTVRERFETGIADLTMTRRMYPFRYPLPPDDVVEFFREHYGPMKMAFASLDESGRKRLRRDLAMLWEEDNEGSADTTVVHAEYLEVVATKAG